MLEALTDFYLKSNGVTLGILALLSIYFLALVWVFFYRYFSLNDWLSKETESLQALLMGASSVATYSYLNHFVKTSNNISKEIFDLANLSATKEATRGLSLLSIIASTSPFIGLFGTVVSILDTFDNIGQASGTMAIIAAGVSDALIATAAGIFVAVFAYTFHQIIKRKSFELLAIIKMQSDSVLSRVED